MSTIRLKLSMAALACALLAACSTPSAPQRPAVYDFGPPAAAGAANRPALEPLALAEIEAPSALDSSAMLYRLAYADARELKPYALAQWSMPPAQLVRQRLRETLARERSVLTPGDVGARAMLRVELDEFSQVFDQPGSSAALLSLRATLSRVDRGGEQLVAQRGFVVRLAAPTPNAAGGARALADATDAASEQIAQWLRQSLAGRP